VSLRRLGALSLSIIETLLVFVALPAAVIAVVYGIGYSGGTTRARRYRPGRPFEFTPVWFLAAPEQHAGKADVRPDNTPAVGGSQRQALEKKAAGGGNLVISDVTTQDATGGASDRW
jgi:hypothetical protein